MDMKLSEIGQTNSIALYSVPQNSQVRKNSSFSAVLGLLEESQQQDRSMDWSQKALSGPIAEELQSRYDLDCMGKQEYYQPLAELTDLGVLTDEDQKNAHSRPMFFGCQVVKNTEEWNPNLRNM
ncbi:MAG: hypothetical protein HFJ84_04745 [Clostridiales bacterium]|jgi:hypothetical protein|nr:hypothetical protein [Clostridiales bacterium]